MNPISALQAWLLNASPEKKRKAVLIGVGGIASLALFLTSGSGDAASEPIDSGPMFFIGVAVKLLAVLLLIVGGAVMLRRWKVGRPTKGPGRQMRLVETVRLTPRQAIHVVEVAGQHFLIGATDNGISILSQVNLPQPAESPAEASPEPAQPELNFEVLFSNLKQVALSKAAGSNPGGRS